MTFSTHLPKPICLLKSTQYIYKIKYAIKGLIIVKSIKLNHIYKMFLETLSEKNDQIKDNLSICKFACSLFSNC